jgi:hypothetical protein
VFTVASSGIASLLLLGGRTAHSRFKIPIDLHDELICNITQQMKVAELVRKANLIIWNEAAMHGPWWGFLTDPACCSQWKTRRHC